MKGEGDMQEMDEVYREYSNTVYGFLLSLTHDSLISEELTQETFYQAIRCIEKFDGSCKISTWLCAIAKNQWKAYVRKHKIEDEIDGIEVTSPSAEREVISNLSRIEIIKQLHKIKEPMREIMYLRMFGNLSFKEIGDILGKTENWSRVNYYRGKEKLLKEMKNNE